MVVGRAVTCMGKVASESVCPGRAVPLGKEGYKGKVRIRQVVLESLVLRMQAGAASV